LFDFIGDVLTLGARGEHVAVTAPRWNFKLGGNFGSTTVELPEGNWKHLMMGESFEGGLLRTQTLLKQFPVALLVANRE